MWTTSFTHLINNNKFLDTIRTCEGPAIFDNGFLDPIKASYKPGDQIRFECEIHFQLRGDPVVECNPNGDWSTEFPVCESMTLFELLRSEHYAISFKLSTVKYLKELFLVRFNGRPRYLDVYILLDVRPSMFS